MPIPAAPCTPSAGAAGRVPQRTDYTLAHAGRQFRLGPVTFWIAVGSLVIMAGWSLATGTYFAFHDDVLTRLIARQKEQQFAYEDRIAELRAQVDRITSRQLLDQEQFEQKLEQIMRRQATLESRASTLAGVPDPATTGSIKSRPTPMTEPPTPRDAEGLADQRHRDLHRAARPRGAAGIARAAGRVAVRLAAPAKPTAVGVEGTLARLQASLDRVEARQTATLNTLEERFDSKAKRIRSVLTDLGMDGKKRHRPAPQVAAVGGPFVPVTLRKDAGAFERQLYRIHVARANVDRLTRTLDRRAGAQADHGRDRPVVRLRRALRSVPRPAGDAHRPRLPQQHRRPGARHRQRHGREPRAGAAATARWSRSITATASRPATATCRRST